MFAAAMLGAETTRHTLAGVVLLSDTAPLACITHGPLPPPLACLTHDAQGKPDPAMRSARCCICCIHTSFVFPAAGRWRTRMWAAELQVLFLLLCDTYNTAVENLKWAQPGEVVMVSLVAECPVSAWLSGLPVCCPRIDCLCCVQGMAACGCCEAAWGDVMPLRDRILSYPILSPWAMSECLETPELCCKAHTCTCALLPLSWTHLPLRCSTDLEPGGLRFQQGCCYSNTVFTDVSVPAGAAGDRLVQLGAPGTCHQR
jgi:hypothetical protein